MEYSVIILLLPLCMFLFLGLVGHKLSERVAGILGTIGLSVAAVLAYVVAFNYFTMPRNAEGVFDTLQPINFEWLRFTEHLHIDLGILLDPISVMMLVVITTVSLMVHIYSMGYMKGERGFQRYYAFVVVQLLHVGVGGSDEHFPNVYFLGVGRCFFLFAHRILLY